MRARQKGKQSEKFKFIFKIEKWCNSLKMSNFQFKVLDKLGRCNENI